MIDLIAFMYGEENISSRACNIWGIPTRLDARFWFSEYSHISAALLQMSRARLASPDRAATCKTKSVTNFPIVIFKSNKVPFFFQQFLLIFITLSPYPHYLHWWLRKFLKNCSTLHKFITFQFYLTRCHSPFYPLAELHHSQKPSIGWVWKKWFAATVCSCMVERTFWSIPIFEIKFNQLHPSNWFSHEKYIIKWCNPNH